MKPPSLRTYSCGRTMSGKTTLLRNLWADRQARVLVLDQTGEFIEPGALVVDTMPQLVAALRQVAGRDRWRICAMIPETDYPALARLLLPGVQSRVRSYCEAVGGLALIVDECDLVAGRGADHAVTSLWRRGRHVGLSLIAATQRPADVHRVVTSQSQWISISQLHEGRDRDYIRALLPSSARDAFDGLQQYWALLLDTVKGLVYHLDPERCIRAVYR